MAASRCSASGFSFAGSMSPLPIVPLRAPSAGPPIQAGREKSTSVACAFKARAESGEPSEQRVAQPRASSTTPASLSALPAGRPGLLVPSSAANKSAKSRYSPVAVAQPRQCEPSADALSSAARLAAVASSDFISVSALPPVATAILAASSAALARRETLNDASAGQADLASLSRCSVCERSNRSVGPLLAANLRGQAGQQVAAFGTV